MPQTREDDLFRESTMTFGQHLGELRACLFKSVLGLVAGFLVGLLVGDRVVQFIQRPLLSALTTYYEKDAVDRFQSESEKLQQSGQKPSWTAEDVEHRVYQEHMLADKVYIDPAELLQELRTAYPSLFQGVELPPQTKSPGEDGKEKLRLFLWHSRDDDPRLQSKSMGTTEAFTVYIKASLLVGVLLASPWIFYQIWHFVAAGLYPHERHYVQIYLPFSLSLFLAGAALAFFVVFTPVLNFLLSYNRSLGILPEPRINEWLSFVLILPLGFGIGFQLPLVMLFLERIGVFSVRSYLAQWRIAVLVIFVVAAILTPPDPYSMMFMAGPLTLLYFGGILLCKYLPRKTSPFGDSTTD